MLIRSYEDLDFALAWTRVASWAKAGAVDVPDRLPYEVLGRLLPGQHPVVRREHHIGAPLLVTSTKKTGTGRVLARVRPVDLLLYQALVDRLAGDLERALGSAKEVIGYRQAVSSSAADPFEGSPSRDMFEQRLAEISDFGLFDGYALTADISGYYLHIEIDELERRLLAASRQAAVIADLCELLRVWQLLGIRGLPQGLLPSRPLANLYLTPVDRTLRIDPEVQFIRWMDDLIVTSKGFHHARSVQDRLERQLYALGLSLRTAFKMTRP